MTNENQPQEEKKEVVAIKFTREEKIAMIKSGALTFGLIVVVNVAVTVASNLLINALTNAIEGSSDEETEEDEE